MNNKKTLLLITAPLDQSPTMLCRSLIDDADKVVMVQEGVYTRQKEGSDVWPDHWFVLNEDAEARRIKSNCHALDYQGLVTAIEEHKRIVTL